MRGRGGSTYGHGIHRNYGEIIRPVRVSFRGGGHSPASGQLTERLIADLGPRREEVVLGAPLAELCTAGGGTIPRQLWMGVVGGTRSRGRVYIVVCKEVQWLIKDCCKVASSISEDSLIHIYMYQDLSGYIFHNT